MTDAAVTAVIPTTGRPTALRAVRSATSQGDHVRAVVVWDSADAPSEELIAEPRCVVVRTGGGYGGAVARNLGVQASTTEWVGFLDDDDEWMPGKTRLQLDAAQEVLAAGAVPLLSGQVLTRRAGREATTEAVPATTYTEGPVEDYLFRGRGLSFQRPAIQTSTLLAPRTLAVAVPWDERLRRHQDWDWIVRAANHDGVRVVQLKVPVTVLEVGSPGSVSASPDWVSTWEWGRRQKPNWHAGTYADFMLGQTLRQALNARDAAAAQLAFGEALRTGSWSPGALALGASAIVPRSVLANIADRVGSRRAQKVERT